jgi:hypothetical protein
MVTKTRRTVVTNGLVPRRESFATCPACKKEIYAEFHTKTESVQWDGDQATAQLKLIGIRVSHDCVPMQPR